MLLGCAVGHRGKHLWCLVIDFDILALTCGVQSCWLLGLGSVAYHSSSYKPRTKFGQKNALKRFRRIESQSISSLDPRSKTVVFIIVGSTIFLTHSSCHEIQHPSSRISSSRGILRLTHSFCSHDWPDEASVKILTGVHKAM